MTNTFENGSYGFSTDPTTRSGVSQHLAAKVREKLGAKGQWWFCGHAALATAINIQRNGKQKDLTDFVDTSYKVGQLSWIHEKLSVIDSRYLADPNKQADINALKSAVDRYQGTEFSSTKIFKSTIYRTEARDEILGALRGMKSVILLASITINKIEFGHFMVVWKIDYSHNDGGTAHYYDLYLGRYGAMKFSNLLDKMAAYRGKYSALTIKRRR